MSLVRIEKTPFYETSPITIHLLTASSDGKCQNSLECRSFLGENSVCKENACACQENYHNYNKKCIASKHLNEACESDGECYQQILTDNALRCNLADKKCICREPFKADGDQCSKGKKITPHHGAILTLISHSLQGI